MREFGFQIKAFLCFLGLAPPFQYTKIIVKSYFTLKQPPYSHSIWLHLRGSKGLARLGWTPVTFPIYPDNINKPSSRKYDLKQQFRIAVSARPEFHTLIWTHGCRRLHSLLRCREVGMFTGTAFQQIRNIQPPIGLRDNLNNKECQPQEDVNSLEPMGPTEKCRQGNPPPRVAQQRLQLVCPKRGCDHKRNHASTQTLSIWYMKEQKSMHYLNFQGRELSQFR